MSQLVGSSIEVCIGHDLFFKDKRSRIRGSLDLLFKKVVQTHILYSITACRMPGSGSPAGREHPFSLLWCKQGQIRESSLRVVYDAFEQRLEVAEHASHGLGFKQIRTVF